MKHEAKYNILVDRTQLEDALDKAARLRDLLQEAKSLAAELSLRSYISPAQIEVEK